jgi:hypothetical protein
MSFWRLLLMCDVVLVDTSIKKAINAKIAELQPAHEIIQAEINSLQDDDGELIAQLELWKPKHVRLSSF